MAADNPTPLATVGQLTAGAFSDLVKDYPAAVLTDLMIQATRACEDHCDRRLAPFTNLVETQRADALDVEDALDAYIPLDPMSQLGVSRAASLGSTMLVRHFWVRESPPRYPDLWTGSISSISLRRSFSGTQSLDVTAVQFEPDTGHCRFQLGTFAPPGTTILVTYSGGYSTVPASLVRACVYMAASIAVRELDPVQTGGHDPDLLHNEAIELLAPFLRG